MSTDALISALTNTNHYEAALRISEGLASCHVPEEVAKTLANHLGEFLQFDFLDILVLKKEDSKEIEWHAWGKGHVAAPDLPVQELPGWDVIIRKRCTSLTGTVTRVFS